MDLSWFNNKMTSWYNQKGFFTLHAHRIRNDSYSYLTNTFSPCPQTSVLSLHTQRNSVVTLNWKLCVCVCMYIYIQNCEYVCEYMYMRACFLPRTYACKDNCIEAERNTSVSEQSFAFAVLITFSCADIHLRHVCRADESLTFCSLPWQIQGHKESWLYPL